MSEAEANSPHPGSVGCDEEVREAVSVPLSAPAAGTGTAPGGTGKMKRLCSKISRSSEDNIRSCGANYVAPPAQNANNTEVLSARSQKMKRLCSVIKAVQTTSSPLAQSISAVKQGGTEPGDSGTQVATPIAYPIAPTPLHRGQT